MFGKNFTRNVLPTQQPKRVPIFKINLQIEIWMGYHKSFGPIVTQ